MLLARVPQQGGADALPPQRGIEVEVVEQVLVGVDHREADDAVVERGDVGHVGLDRTAEELQVLRARVQHGEPRQGGGPRLPEDGGDTPHVRRSRVAHHQPRHESRR